jgi:hypothetical protein
VRGIGDLAAAWREYLRRHKAAVEAQNLAQQVVLLAEAKIGAELEAAQKRGEVAQHGGDRGNQHSGGKLPDGNLANIGLTPKRAHEARKLAHAGAERIADARAQADAEGRRLTKTEVLRSPPSQGSVPRRWADADPAAADIDAVAIRFERWLLAGESLVTLPPAELCDAFARAGRTLPLAQVDRIGGAMNELITEMARHAAREN